MTAMLSAPRHAVITALFCSHANICNMRIKLEVLKHPRLLTEFYARVNCVDDPLGLC